MLADPEELLARVLEKRLEWDVKALHPSSPACDSTSHTAARVHWVSTMWAFSDAHDNLHGREERGIDTQLSSQPIHILRSCNAVYQNDAVYRNVLVGILNSVIAGSS